MILVVLLALLAPGYAHATGFEDRNGVTWDVVMPPLHWFDKRPDLQIGKNMIVRRLSEDDVTAVCSKAIGKFEQFGCAFVLPDSCTVLVREDLPIRFREIVEMHEVAHCLGWPADHPVD